MSIIDGIMNALSFSFFVRALVVGGMLSVVCGFLGTFIIIRKEAIIGHTLANMAFLGIALGILFSVNLSLMSAIVCLFGVFLIVILKRSQFFASDSVLEFTAQFAMASAIIVISLLQGYRTDLMQYLFGDILAISRSDMTATILLTVVVLISIIVMKRKLLQVTFNEELAHSSGTSLILYELLFLLLVGLVVVFAVKIVGVILMTAFLVISPNISKVIAKNFQQMLILSGILALLGTTVGLFVSYFLDVPSGPMIILVLGGMLFLALLSRVILARSR
jgi:ABC-type Mn2+/Zn2+ transport system permease subunit